MLTKCHILGASSDPSKCLKDGKRNYGTDYLGDPFVTTTPRDCLDQCQQNQDCAAIVWFKSSKKCNFFNSVDDGDMGDESNAVFGKVNCLTGKGRYLKDPV